MIHTWATPPPVNYPPLRSEKIFNVENLENPILHHEYEGVTNAIDHNGYVKGDNYYIANYTAGLRVIDIENIEAGQSVPIDELVLPEGVRIAALAKGGDASISVIRVSTPKGALEEDMEDAVEDDEAKDSQEGGDSENG